MPELPKQQLEINASHPLIKSLYHQRATHPLMAKEVAEQVCSPSSLPPSLPLLLSGTLSGSNDANSLKFYFVLHEKE